MRDRNSEEPVPHAQHPFLVEPHSEEVVFVVSSLSAQYRAV